MCEGVANQEGGNGVNNETLAINLILFGAGPGPRRYAVGNRQPVDAAGGQRTPAVHRTGDPIGDPQPAGGRGVGKPGYENQRRGAQKTPGGKWSKSRRYLRARATVR